MLDKLACKSLFFSRWLFRIHNYISIASEDQENITFTCTYGTSAFKRMPFRLCNASSTFLSCMMSIFFDMVEDTIEVFMDDFLLLAPHSVAH